MSEPPLVLFGFFVLNHSLPHEVDKGEFEVVDAIPAVREHLQERIPSDYAKMNNDSVAESNLVIYPVTQKWFSGENSLSLYGNTQFSVLLGELSDSRTSGVLEMELPEALGNEADFFLALRLKDLIEERSNNFNSSRRDNWYGSDALVSESTRPVARAISMLPAMNARY